MLSDFFSQFYIMITMITIIIIIIIIMMISYNNSHNPELCDYIIANLKVPPKLGTQTPNNIEQRSLFELSTGVLW